MRSFALRAILIALSLMEGLNLAHSDGQPSDITNQALQTQLSKFQSVSRARNHPSYQVFAARTRLPAITNLDRNTVIIGNQWKLDFCRARTMDSRERNALAEQFEMPVESFEGIVRKLSANIPSDRKELAAQLQTAVIDYKYLSERWGRYHPPAGAEWVKAEAARCLKNGDLEKAWQMYIELPKPSAPTGLQTIASQPDGHRQ